MNGSDYSLLNRRLFCVYKQGFAALAARAPYVPQGKGAASAIPDNPFSPKLPALRSKATNVCVCLTKSEPILNGTDAPPRRRSLPLGSQGERGTPTRRASVIFCARDFCSAPPSTYFYFFSYCVCLMSLRSPVKTDPITLFKLTDFIASPRNPSLLPSSVAMA